MSGARDYARAFAVAIPPLLVATWLAAGRTLAQPWWALAVAAAAALALVHLQRRAQQRRLQTASAVLASYREGDFSVRARMTAAVDEPLRDLLAELNELGDTLRQQRLGEMEAWALLRKVMGEIDVAVLAVSDEGAIRLANDAATRVLGDDRDALVKELIAGEAPRVVQHAGTWELRRGTFRLSGEPHTLVVLSDVSRTLRDNERDAWRRLIRVMGHEINNSLSPIQSMSESLLGALDRPRGAEFDEDLRDALGVIARRSGALGRFMASYAKLAKLPQPNRVPVLVAEVVRKVALLEQRLAVEVVAGPDDATALADRDQLEQVLINLVKNAAEATLPLNGGVRIAWTARADGVEIAIEDDGPGVDDTANLFVPFFTTKPEGSGIGLVLSREIIEAHEGSLTLTSRRGARGAVARVRLAGAS